MSTTRPLMQMGIGALEDMFKNQGENSETLALLNHELGYRQVPRAMALLERVQKAISAIHSRGVEGGVSPVTATGPVLELPDLENLHLLRPQIRSRGATAPIRSLAVPIVLPDLFAHANVSSHGDQDVAVESDVSIEAATIKDPLSSQAPNALPLIALEDACRILNVHASDGWEKVEMARRVIVSKSSPLVTKDFSDAVVQKLMVDARLANDAAIVIAARRSGQM